MRLPSMSAGLAASTVTPGRMPPVLSVTSPVMVWAIAVLAPTDKASTTATAVNERLMLLLLDADAAMRERKTSTDPPPTAAQSTPNRTACHTERNVPMPRVPDIVARDGLLSP